MKKNMGTTDKSVRIIAAIIMAAVYYKGFVTGTLGIVLLAIAGLLILTSLINFCPLYPVLKINTHKEKKA